MNSGSGYQVGKGAWWVGSDGNIWGNIQGIGVRNLGSLSSINANGGALSRAQLNAASKGTWHPADNLRSSYWTQISDPNAPTSNPTTNNVSRRIYTGGGGGGGATITYPDTSAARAADQSAIDQLGNLQATLDNNQRDNYNSTIAGYDNDMTNNTNKYNQEVTSNNQDLANERQTIRSNGQQGLRSLLAQLAAIGANGSGVDLADSAVSNDMNKQFGSSNDTSNKNLTSLSTWLDTLKNIDSQRRKDAAQTLQNNLMADQNNVLTQKASLLKDLASQWATAGNKGAAASVLGSAAALNPQLASTQRVVQSFNGTPLNVAAPTLAEQSTAQAKTTAPAPTDNTSQDDSNVTSPLSKKNLPTTSAVYA